MATNAEQLQQHVISNPGVYRAAIANGVITEEDLKAAGNAGGNYSYADQDAALQRINDAFGEYAKNNPEHQQLQKFVAGIPQISKFTPNQDEWMNYNQEQMGRLAEQMKFNWKNKEDRSQMMKQLQDAKIVKDRQKIYDDYKKENPVAAFINEHIIAPNVSQRLKKGQEIQNKDIALDVANVGTYLVPGAGGMASKAGKAALFGADAAAQGTVGALSDINQGNELGLHNVVQPIIGAGMGTVTELVPRMAKAAVDAVTGGFGGRMSKKVGDVGEDWITKVFGDEVGNAKQVLRHDAEAAMNVPTVRKNASEATKTQLKSEGKSITPNAADKKLAQQKSYYAEHPDKWSAHAKKLSDEEYNKFMSDPNFKKAIEAGLRKESKVVKVGKQAAQGTSRSAGRGIAITESNRQREKNAKPSIKEVFASPEMADYIRLRRRGYAPQIPEKFKEYKEQVDAEIFDFDKNLR